MKLSHHHLLLAGSALALTLSAVSAFARTSVVDVKLWDKGAMSMNMLGQSAPMGMSMGMGAGSLTRACSPQRTTEPGAAVKWQRVPGLAWQRKRLGVLLRVALDKPRLEWRNTLAQRHGAGFNVRLPRC